MSARKLTVHTDLPVPDCLRRIRKLFTWMCNAPTADAGSEVPEVIEQAVGADYDR